MSAHGLHDPVPWKEKIKIYFIASIARTLKTH